MLFRSSPSDPSLDPEEFQRFLEVAPLLIQGVPSPLLTLEKLPFSNDGKILIGAIWHQCVLDQESRHSLERELNELLKNLPENPLLPAAVLKMLAVPDLPGPFPGRESISFNSGSMNLFLRAGKIMISRGNKKGAAAISTWIGNTEEKARYLSELAEEIGRAHV